MKTIRFKNDWRYSRQGDVIEEGDGVAELLIARGIAEEVKPAEEGDVEEQTQENEAEEAAGDDAGIEPAQDGGETALPQVITRQVPGPTEGGARQYPGRRGGRG